MAFARYPSLNETVVFVTGGASGIGEQIVRAFAEQGSKIGFIDLDAERGRALVGELERGGHDDPLRGRRPARHRRLEARFRRPRGGARAGAGAGQQCRPRRPAWLAGGDARVL